MSWSLASLLLLCAALAVGFAWYERTQPSARLLSVVGTLAALAILGRIAFAPIPNVKPTTDIVLIAGFALGGAPGFAVGAVAALGSNLFFGQGPWTPWQMAAWGLIGMLGALLARATRHEVRRIPMALACALAGLLFGVILDVSTWTISGAHTLDELLAISSLSLPFNIAHAVGNFVFFLAFGPALIRAVARARTRFEIAWQPVLPVLIALALFAVPAQSARAQTPADRGIAYLEAARNPDGGWGGAPGQASNGLHSAWALYAMAAAGRPADATDLLVARLGKGKVVGDVLRTILALRASGGDPRDAGGRDLVAEMLARQKPSGTLGGYTSFTSYLVLALTATGEQRGLKQAARWVISQQNRDGGFTVYQRGGPSDADDTGYAVEALVAAGRRKTRTVRRAAAYLERAQHGDGGYALTRGAPTNAQSTAFAVLGLAAAGVDPATVRRNGRSPLDYLRALQDPDGSFRYSKTSRQTPVWVTAQAVLALLERPLPVVARPAATARQRPGWGVGEAAMGLLGLLVTRLRALL
ncbi:MAG: Prenyltransferase/squalene oxidase [Solirubrobacterales bacterium]|nr:Prenyltransferase/squalene oxidase [Solirubrobacterales bacterium]